MSKGPTTKVSNAKLKHLIKLAETFCIKAENGEWGVEPGTYQAILKSVDHVKTEMAKQDRQRRRTMNISYIEDPDGNWIEFVETHKVPIMKKLGWYLDLKKKDPKKRLPNWLLKAMSIGNRVK